MTFTEQVFDAVTRIPRGETMSYRDVAVRIGCPRSARAVARALSTNYNVRIPCHRVICSNGTLGGYNRGGEDAKRSLLLEEGYKISLDYGNK